MIRKLTVLGTAFIYLLTTSFTSFAVTDRDILSDPVSNTYRAESTGEAIAGNLGFSDLPLNHWAKEPVTRLGALSVVKGYNFGGELTYRPDDSVSNEEALAFLMRLIGQEEAAVQAAQNIASDPADPAITIWSRGYLQTAAGLGVISQAQLQDGLVIDQGLLDPEFNWMRRDPVTREQVAMWLVQALDANEAGSLAPVYVHQEIFSLNDWETIGTEFLPYVEAVMSEDIMVGDGDDFKPKEPLTRAEMAQIMINLEELLYKAQGLTLKGGVVGSITTANDVGTIGSQEARTYRIRNDEGLVDRVDLVFSYDSRGRRDILDVPVLTPGGVAGLNSLKEGDHIQYLVDDEDRVMKYIYSTGYGAPVKVIGTLQAFDRFDEGKITLENESKIPFTYQMVGGIYDAEKNTIEIGDDQYPLSQAPVANVVTLTILNDLVTHIDYDGAMPLTLEVSGIVKEVDATFGFITIEAWNGGEVTKYFDRNVSVEKEQYYDNEDEIGYLDELYPTYGFDERDSSVSALEPGDIVHLNLDPSNPQYVTAISAKTNYSVKFGTIEDIRDYGAEGLNVRVAYNDGSLGALEIPGDTPVFLRGLNAGVNGLQEGQVVKLLLNQAVLGPGRTLETVKQVDVDPYGNLAMKLYKGEPGHYNEIEESFSLLNSYTLSPVGWADYAYMTPLKLSGDGVEVYYKGDRVSMSYMDRYLKTQDMMAFAVTEDYYGLERLAKIILDDGRDEVLDATSISYANGYDKIRLVSSVEDIAMNDGTIVIKNGHIVSTSSILAPDYAQVVLGDRSSAVMVNITQEPNNDALTILRGRIDSIEPGQAFTVVSNALLKEMEWIYSPVERAFTLSYDTVIVDGNGLQSLDEFVDYSELSKVDEVYTIIADGTKATHLYKSPYATEGVSGTVYENDGDSIAVRDAYVYDGVTKQWEVLSLKNNYAQIQLTEETVIIKNNRVVEADDILYGDRVRVLVTEDLAEEVKLNNNRIVDGYIIFVE